MIVEGNVTFTQEGNGPVHIVGTISGLHEGSYGFHVHEKGDTVGGDCMRTGSHFNPHMVIQRILLNFFLINLILYIRNYLEILHALSLKENHGGPSLSVSRHVGDLGNIQFDEEQVSHIDFTDSVISLFGENSIIGRGLVVHEGTDDFGRGGASDSLTTGHAGKRAGCGVIGIM